LTLRGNGQSQLDQALAEGKWIAARADRGAEGWSSESGGSVPLDLLRSAVLGGDASRRLKFANAYGLLFDGYLARRGNAVFFGEPLALWDYHGSMLARCRAVLRAPDLDDHDPEVSELLAYANKNLETVRVGVDLSWQWRRSLPEGFATVAVMTLEPNDLVQVLVMDALDMPCADANIGLCVRPGCGRTLRRTNRRREYCSDKCRKLAHYHRRQTRA
jgi:hypothetical protein